jgi:hypothetical protein
MRTTSILLLLLALAACSNSITMKRDGSGHDVTDVPGERKALGAMLLAQQKAWNRGDLEGFMQGYWHSDSMQFITAKGTRKGWDSTLASYRRGYPDKEKLGRLDFTIQEISFLDTPSYTGHIRGLWRLFRKSDTPSGHFSLITRKINGSHKIVIDHTW